MLTLTPSAISKIQTIILEENNPLAKLRTFVQGGGCSGMSYGFTIDTEKNEDDFIISDGIILVDSISMQYLSGSTIDYVEDLMGSSFRIANPNAETSCGCGSSFSVAQDFEYDDFGHGI